MLWPDRSCPCPPQPDEYILYRGDTGAEIFRVLTGTEGKPSRGVRDRGCLLDKNGNSCEATECRVGNGTVTSNGPCVARLAPTSGCPKECLWFAYRDVLPNGIFTIPRPAGVSTFLLQVNGACPSTGWEVTVGCTNI